MLRAETELGNIFERQLQFLIVFQIVAHD